MWTAIHLHSKTDYFFPSSFVSWSSLLFNAWISSHTHLVAWTSLCCTRLARGTFMLGEFSTEFRPFDHSFIRCLLKDVYLTLSFYFKSIYSTLDVTQHYETVFCAFYLLDDFRTVRILCSSSVIRIIHVCPEFIFKLMNLKIILYLTYISWIFQKIPPLIIVMLNRYKLFHYFDINE